MDDTLNPSDLNDVLKSNYVLLTVQMRRWSANRPDAQLAAELAAKHGGTADMFKAGKKLMASVPEYKALDKALNAIRTYSYGVTLPWSNASNGAALRGPRLCPATRVLEVIQHLKALQDEVPIRLDELKAVYPQRVAEALAKQGTAADPSQYPDVSELDELFGVTVDIEPVPTMGDFSRMNIPAAAAAGLGQRMAKRQAAVVENAMADLKARTVEAVGNMATVLGKFADGEKTKLYESLVGNVQTMADMLRHSNLTGDPAVAELSKRMDELVAHDIKTLRANPGVARDVAEKAKAAVESFTAPRHIPWAEPDTDVEAAPVRSNVQDIRSDTLDTTPPDGVDDDPQHDDVDEQVETVLYDVENWF